VAFGLKDPEFEVGVINEFIGFDAGFGNVGRVVRLLLGESCCAQKCHCNSGVDVSFNRAGVGR